MVTYFTYRLDPGVLGLPVVINAFLSQREWYWKQTIGGEIVVNDIKRWPDGSMRLVTITLDGQTFTIGECD